VGHFLSGQEFFAIDFQGRGSHHCPDYRLAVDLTNGRFSGVRLDVAKLNEMKFGVEEHMALFATLSNFRPCGPEQFSLSIRIILRWPLRRTESTTRNCTSRP